ncbi:MAG: putative rane protein [Sediminibacterium sp.]|nr:putative rane protein [Sediminibacterium sp.]
MKLLCHQKNKNILSFQGIRKVMTRKMRSRSKTNSGLKKLTFSALMAAAVFAVLSCLHFELKMRLLVGWDVFCLTMIAFSWVLFFTTNQKEVSKVVESQDEGIKAIFGIVLVAVCFSLFGTLLLLKESTGNTVNKIVHILVSLSPVLLSWILLHTIFTMRYAHLYNDHNKLNSGTDVGGIDFPTKAQPDYVDFAYFSFVIGMTFQVSDVQVNSRVIRRFVLLHSLISFIFNTTIVALTINAVAGLTK